MFISLKSNSNGLGIFLKGRNIRSVEDCSTWRRVTTYDGESYSVKDSYQEIVDLIGQIPPEDLK